jgi:hypothetical protein
VLRRSQTETHALGDEMLQDTLTIDVDFNDVDLQGRLMATRRFASSLRKPDVGEWAFLVDDEGNRCWGRVERVDGLIVYLALDRSTWERITAPDLMAVFARRTDEPAQTVGLAAQPELVH